MDAVHFPLMFRRHSFLHLALPFSLSVSVTIRVSKHLASGDYSDARLVAWLGILEATVLTSLGAAAMHYMRWYVGFLFSADEDVVRRVGDLARWAAIYQLSCGVTAAAQGVLRSTSHQKDLMM